MPVTVLAPPAVVRRELAGVARGGLVNLIGAAVAGLAGFGVTWLVARTLGPDQAGGFFTATAAFVLVGTVAKLGTPTGLVYFIARLRAAHACGSALRRCLWIALGPVTVAALLAGSGLWFGAPALAALTPGGAGPGYVTQIRVLAVFLPAAVLCDVLLAASRGWQVMRPTVLLDRLLRPGTQLVSLGLLAAAAVATPATYALAWVAPYLPTLLLAGYAVLRLLPKGDGSTTDLTASVFWRFTGPRAVASIAQLALQRFDVLLLAGLAGLRAAAIYAVAGRFVVLGQLANQAIALAVQPRLAELLGAGRHAAAKELYQAATGWLVLVAWPLFLGTAVFSSVYLGLFGPGYRGATAVVVVLALAMLVATGCGMVDTVLAMAGRTSWNLANVALALGVNVAADLLLIPRLGALGAAIGLAAAIVTNNVVPLVQIATVLRLHPFGRSTLTAAVLATACFGVLPLTVGAVAGTRPASAFGSAVLGATGYLYALARLRRNLRLDASRERNR